MGMSQHVFSSSSFSNYRGSTILFVLGSLVISGIIFASAMSSVHSMNKSVARADQQADNLAFQSYLKTVLSDPAVCLPQLQTALASVTTPAPTDVVAINAPLRITGNPNGAVIARGPSSIPVASGGSLGTTFGKMESTVERIFVSDFQPISGTTNYAANLVLQVKAKGPSAGPIKVPMVLERAAAGGLSSCYSKEGGQADKTSICGVLSSTYDPVSDRCVAGSSSPPPPGWPKYAAGGYYNGGACSGRGYHATVNSCATPPPNLLQSDGNPLPAGSVPYTTTTVTDFFCGTYTICLWRAD